jgi:hypothetical protein
VTLRARRVSLCMRARLHAMRMHTGRAPGLQGPGAPCARGRHSVRKQGACRLECKGQAPQSRISSMRDSCSRARNRRPMVAQRTAKCAGISCIAYPPSRSRAKRLRSRADEP